MKLPEGVLPDRSRRSGKLVAYPIRTVLTVRKGSRVLDAVTTVNNVAKDHRLRLLLPTGLAKASHSWGHMPFDVVKRPVYVPSGEGWREAPTGTHPQKWFVDVSDGAAGLAVLNRGISQYEVLETRERPVALTFMRCFQMRNSVQNIDYPDQPGSQCQGVQEFRWAVMPHAGDWDQGGVMAAAAAWNVPPFICRIGVGSGAACREAVGAGPRACPSESAKGAACQPLPPEASLIELASDGLVFSGIKPSEDGSALVVRLYNPTERTVGGTITMRMPIRKAEEVKMDETPVGELAVEDGRRVKVDGVGTRKVVTVKLSRA